MLASCGGRDISCWYQLRDDHQLQIDRVLHDTLDITPHVQPPGA